MLTETPDAMRGRVSAVNSVFIGASNELGGFESGLAASLLGPIVAVVGGGVGTILVVGTVALLWPQMRRLGRLGAALASQESIEAVTAPKAKASPRGHPPSRDCRPNPRC